MKKKKKNMQNKNCNEASTQIFNPIDSLPSSKGCNLDVSEGVFTGRDCSNLQVNTTPIWHYLSFHQNYIFVLPNIGQRPVLSHGL